MERLRELEKRQSEIEGQILIEKSKAEITITESQIRKFYNDALSKNSKMMIDLLIKVIILYDDKIEIFFKTPLTRGSDDDRGFSFAIKKNRNNLRRSATENPCFIALRYLFTDLG